MSHVFMKSTNIHAAKEELFEILRSTIKENMFEYDQERIKKAYEFACVEHHGEKRYSGDEYVTHTINVAIILAEMGASEEAVIAGLLHDIILEKSSAHINKITSEFSKRIVKIITDVKRANINECMNDEDAIMVMLADRIHNMRTIEFIDNTRWKEKAKETLDVFSPIAGRLNNRKIIAELNDLSLKYI